jgi:hypothetical protein
MGSDPGIAMSLQSPTELEGLTSSHPAFHSSAMTPAPRKPPSTATISPVM